ncbi:MAG: hypothetical protein ACRDPF_19825 [Streptosporangiaceae bacterium]
MPDAVARPAPRPRPASQPQPASQPEIRATGPAAGKRLAWLDALRGIAALCVVFDHLTYSVLQPVRDSVYHWFDPGQYPWRRALYVTVLVFGLTLVAVPWHVSPLAENLLAIRKTFNSLEVAGLTFAVAMLCRHKRVPRALAWLGLISYSAYLLHPVLIEVYDSVPETRNQNFVPASRAGPTASRTRHQVSWGRGAGGAADAACRAAARIVDIYPPDCAGFCPRCGPSRRLSSLAVLATGSAAMPIYRRSFRVPALLSGQFRVPFLRAPGRAIVPSSGMMAR